MPPHASHRCLRAQPLAHLTLAASLLASTGSVAHAALIVGEVQFNSGNVSPAPLTPSSGDLLETALASFSGENTASLVRNGTTGTAHENSASASAQIWGNSITLYTFDTVARPLGYDLAEIRVFTGWHDARAGQSFTLSYSVVGDPGFITVGTVNVPASNGLLLTRTYDSFGGSIAVGIDQLRLVQNDQGLFGSGSVFREIDVLEFAPAPVPEPANAALGLGALALATHACSRRRRPARAHPSADEPAPSRLHR